MKPSGIFLAAAVFRRAHIHTLLKFLMEIVYVFVADFGGNLIDFHISMIEQINGAADPHLI